MLDDHHLVEIKQENAGYRKDIDGLRAVAILSVVIYHAFPDILPGGFVGVDVFFVISGFLITGIILKGLQNKSFSFSSFYARRIKRIFPALSVVLIFCLLLGWQILTGDEYKKLGEHVAGGAGFVANILLWSEAGYFDRASEMKPLLHLWSLGIEEQFYIVWPLILFLGCRKHIHPLLLITSLFFTSFILSFYLTFNHQVAAFYSPLSRFWELLAGSILAYFSLTQTCSADKDTSKLNSFISVAGISLILASGLLFDKNVAFPGWRALLPVVGAGLLIMGGPSAMINRLILSNRVLVFVGLISYPLYLWHWPLLSFARIDNTGEISQAVTVALVILSVVLSYLTYRFMEKPVRFSFSNKKAAPALFFLMLSVGLAGFACFQTDGIPGRFSADIQSYVLYKYDPAIDARSGSCWLEAGDRANAYASDCIDKPTRDKNLIVVWGDSFAARFFTGVRAFGGADLPIAQFTRNACPPVLDYGYDKCKEANHFIIGQIEMLKPSTVLLYAHWNGYVKTDKNHSIIQSLVPTIRKLHETGVSHVIVIGPSPLWKGSLPNLLVRDLRRNRSGQVPARTYKYFDEEVIQMEALLKKQVQNMGNVVYFSALDAMCTSSGCLTTVNGRADGLTTWDEGHFTTQGALYLAKRLDEATGVLSSGRSHSLGLK